MFLASVEKLTGSRGSPHLWEFPKKLDGPKLGRLKEQCLDQIRAELDEVYISEHVRGSAIPSRDPPNYENCRIVQWAFFHMHR